MTSLKFGCDVLLGQSYYLRFDQKLWQAMQPFPPLGTLYAASILRENGYQVALFDAMLAEGEYEWERALEIHQPEFAVLFEDNFNYLSKMCLLRMRQAALTMIDMALKKGCVVIIGGADASDHSQLYLENGAHYVLSGEGDQTLVELINQLRGINSKELDQIEGLAWLDPVHDSPGVAMRQTERRPDISVLDELPFPAWDLVDIERYREIWLKEHGYFAINMVTTRGCPFHCNWCAKPIWGQRYHVRSPENVLAEILWIKDVINPDYIWFVDDIFGLKPGWITRFSNAISSAGVKIPFKCLSRVDLLLREGEIQSLDEAGADIIWVGAESGSQKILDAMEKGTQVEQIYEATRLLHQAGLRVGFFLQFGYPGETRADIKKTFQMVRDCQPDDIGMSVSYPLPGTGFYRAVKDQLGSRKNWFDSDDLAMLYQGPFSTEFYRQLHVALHREFRMRKTWKMIWGAYRREVWKAPGSRSQNRIKLVGTWFYYKIRLLLDRWKLNRLSRAPHQGVLPVKNQMSPKDAARPTPQVE
ncbi:MAG: radical SAM protein [Chloroflexi bacterium RBG_16_54_18]|nr:MAG: radical SAM protein [Chloroflexi bacterium RBG_16_54_18]